ncbi:MAG: hypothetical protein WCT39_07395, partial [Candidatus Margulisiibacteriota bacterium]
MLCQKCNQRPASVHITKIVNGQKATRHLCGVCAAEEGLLPGGGGFDDLGFPGFLEFPDIFASLFKRRPA